MLKIIITAVLLAFASFTVVASDYVGNAANGEKLYNESTCATACHAEQNKVHSEDFTSPDRLVLDLAALNVKVRKEDSKLSTSWFDTDIYDVVAYLNEQYYKFPTPEEATK